LNLPEASVSLLQIEQQLKKILGNGSAAEKDALKQLLKATGLV
jgi:hypothetical protein